MYIFSHMRNNKSVTVIQAPWSHRAGEAVGSQASGVKYAWPAPRSSNGCESCESKLRSNLSFAAIKLSSDTIMQAAHAHHWFGLALLQSKYDSRLGVIVSS